MNKGLRAQEISQLHANLGLQPHDLFYIELLAQLREGTAVYLGGNQQGSKGDDLQVLELNLFLLFKKRVEVVAGVGKDLSVVLLPEDLRMQPFHEFLPKR